MLALWKTVILLAPAARGEAEGPVGDARAGRLRRDLHAHHHVVGDLVLDAAVEPLGVLAHDDQVDAVEARRHAGRLRTGRTAA